MIDVTNECRELPCMPELTPEHIRRLQVLFAEEKATAQEIDTVLDVDDLKAKLAKLRDRVPGPGLWSKEVHDRYLGVRRS